MKLDGDLIEKLSAAYIAASDFYEPTQTVYRKRHLAGIAAVACVIADALLVDTTMDEFQTVQMSKGLPASSSAVEIQKCNDLLQSRRSRIEDKYKPVCFGDTREARIKQKKGL